MIVRRRNYQGAGAGFTLYVIFVENLGNMEMLAVDSSKLYSDDGSATINVYYKEVVGGMNPVMESRYYGSAVIAVPDQTVSQTHIIEDLEEGLNYHVRVSAWNGVEDAYGKILGSTPALVEPTKTPSVPSDISMTPVNANALKVAWTTPTDVGGQGITKYRVEYDVAQPKVEVQTVSITSTATRVSGSFCLSFGGFSTSAIPYDATPGRVESALESLVTIGDVAVTQQVNTKTGYAISWTVQFVDNIGSLEMLEADASCNHLVGTAVALNVASGAKGATPTFTSGTVGIYEKALGDIEVVRTKSVQSIILNTTSTDVVGHFYVINSGETSLPIDVYSSAAEVEYILESMLTITDVTVTLQDMTLSSTGPQQGYGRTWTVTFEDSHYQSLLVSTGTVARTTVAVWLGPMGLWRLSVWLLRSSPPASSSPA